ncbi:MAG: hypothetical protein HOL10_06370 [Candidatus Marinimicrobia bacterium]|nr:hypothetical protein [Candidatus Neomarinimicrobiota bacterium]
MDERIFLPNSADLKKINFEQVYYDSLKIISGDYFYLDTENVDFFIIGLNDSGRFLPIDTLPFEIETDPLKGYKYSFNHTFQIPIHFLFAPISFYVVTGDNEVSIDTLFPMYKYPYQNTQAFLTNENLMETIMTDKPRIEDFDYDYPYFAYRYFGSSGMYVLNMETYHQENFGYPSGTALSILGDSLFFDGHNSLVVFDIPNYSYDIDTGFTGKLLQLYWNDFSSMGIDVYNDTIYVGGLFENQPNSGFGFKRYTLSGVFIDTLHSQTWPYCFSIENNKVMTSWSDKIFEWPLNEPQNISTYLSPSVNTSSAKTINGYVYFSDYDKNYIGYLPRGALIEFVDD